MAYDAAQQGIWAQRLKAYDWDRLVTLAEEQGSDLAPIADAEIGRRLAERAKA